VHRCRGAVALPLVGIGGIVCADDAIEFFIAGASAVQIGTATFAQPRAALDILEGIDCYLEAHGIARLADLVGTLRV
jgi:dihydroorotate dehydrogenase (NAD+) catalytic subunit